MPSAVAPQARRAHTPAEAPEDLTTPRRAWAAGAGAGGGAAVPPASAARSAWAEDAPTSVLDPAPVATTRRRGMSPVVPIFLLLMAVIAGAILGGIYLLPKALKGAATSANGPAVIIPTGTPTPTPTVPTMTAGAPSVGPAPAPTVTPGASVSAVTPPPTTAAPPAGTAALQAECQAAGASTADLATCSAAWDFLKRYGPLDQGKTLQQADIGNWWTDPATYYGTKTSLAKLYPQLVAPSEAGTVYSLGTISGFKNNVSVSGRGKGVRVDLDVPFTKDGQADSVTVRYLLVPGTGANAYRIASVEEA